ncbi:BMP family ABC transporter substrate-binding protein [Salinispira pacifica]|uniref:Exported protein (Tpn38b) n=1 Tax=Salinispira pacifica TaxID=1307761 RepID=V5WHK4_9SPIO|nr:BMP family ABC transporter substrate-binding protein [Salinispira pacifica]AHC15095.1 exported protein (tpn38b) [Salinispira pacifica]
MTSIGKSAQRKNINPIRMIVLAAAMMLFTAAGLWAGGNGEAASENFTIAVFIPGQIQGSPTYELLARGVQQAADEANDSMDNAEAVSVKVFEAGYNQAEWGEKLRNLTATGSYDLIVSSNPSIPDLISNIEPLFPEQKYLVMDAENSGQEYTAAVMLNQYEQAYLSGYFAGLVSAHDSLEGANSQLKVGLLAGQEYPVMNNEIQPGYIQGARDAASPELEVDIRVLGNWYDAEKARELADSMIRGGVDVILTIAGSGNQGVVSAAEAAGTYVLWYDSPGYEYAPGTVLGSSMVNIDELTREMVGRAIRRELKYGETRYVGISEAAVDYARDYDEYREFVPEDIRRRMDELIDGIADGSIQIR